MQVTRILNFQKEWVFEKWKQHIAIFALDRSIAFTFRLLVWWSTSLIYAKKTNSQHISAINIWTTLIQAYMFLLGCWGGSISDCFLCVFYYVLGLLSSNNLNIWCFTFPKKITMENDACVQNHDYVFVPTQHSILTTRFFLTCLHNTSPYSTSPPPPPISYVRISGATIPHMSSA